MLFAKNKLIFLKMKEFVGFFFSFLKYHEQYISSNNIHKLSCLKSASVIYGIQIQKLLLFCNELQKF